MNARAHWRNLLASLTCVVGKRYGGCSGDMNLHHVAEASGMRHDYALVPLCHMHHQGKLGIHGLGTKAFLRLYRPPGESEWGLLAWACEDAAKFLATKVANV